MAAHQSHRQSKDPDAPCSTEGEKGVEPDTPGCVHTLCPLGPQGAGCVTRPSIESLGRLASAQPNGVIADRRRVVTADEGEDSEPSVDTGIGRVSCPGPTHEAPNEPGWYSVRTDPNEQHFGGWARLDQLAPLGARLRRGRGRSGQAEQCRGRADATTGVAGFAPNPYAPPPTATADLRATAPGVDQGVSQFSGFIGYITLIAAHAVRVFGGLISEG